MWVRRRTSTKSVMADPSRCVDQTDPVSEHGKCIMVASTSLWPGCSWSVHIVAPSSGFVPAVWQQRLKRRSAALTDGRPLPCALLSPSMHEGDGMGGRGDRSGETQSGDPGAAPPGPPEDRYPAERYPEWRRLGLMTRLVATGLVVRGASAVAKLLRGR